ncbi:LuxR C-terminal-related transcriptional regulator [Actinomycetospora lutea]|uniref:HD domain-containing phosphohydrolase n=1 Tax=Actinomycetospora lutea TaxID=663604 RepID=UPI00236707A9|nr:HD domain-containing phosphohydrolase [Actinomycetospora lutea]MDD7942129.1 LuxR C-terminal-related transcriptional regulator [Actinomycetospora lutea]
MGDDEQAGEVRLAEILGALSLGIDLGFDQPLEHVLRQCLIALRLAERLDLDEDARVAVYYTALLVNVGCHSDAHEQAKWFGDDIALKADKYTHGLHGVRATAAGLRRLGSGSDTILQRLRVGLEFAVSGHKDVDDMIAQHAALARALADELGLPPGTGEALVAAYEQWDGRGWPGRRAGEEVPVAARVVAVAEFTEVAHRVGGVRAVLALVRRQSGRQFDPTIAGAVAADVDRLVADLDAADTWDAVIAAEPPPTIVLSGERFDAALLAIADFVDLKSPYTLGHSRAVADLVAGAGTHLGLAVDELRTVRRAGLVHDFGRLAISNAILDKPGPLGAGEQERVRLVPYVTERMLRRPRPLACLGAIAVAHRERLDGSGHPRGLSGEAIPRAARLLGAADAYRAMREPRPHREALSREAAAAELRADVARGRRDAVTVEAVLRAAGHSASTRREGPAGLTHREAEVLRLLARGLTNRDIASSLTISTKTVGNHVEHIYTKIGTSTRAAAGLFATKHGLLADEEPVP